MKYFPVPILSLAFSVLLPTPNLSAQTWSAPQPLAGTGNESRNTLVDKNGNLHLYTKKLGTAPPDGGRSVVQTLQSNDLVGAPSLLPNFITSVPSVNQQGDPYLTAQDPSGNRIITWFINSGNSLVMSFQSAEGNWGSNVVSVNALPAALALRNNLVVLIIPAPNGTVTVNEWAVGANGTLTARTPIELIDAEYAAVGAAVAIDADNSAVSVFKAGLEVRSARRSAAGVWTLDAAVLDSVVLGSQFISPLYGDSSPGGRLIAAWWITGVGDGTNVDRGGIIRSFVREPAGAIPTTFVNFHSAALDLSGNSTRRDYGVAVDMGLDGTAGILAYTKSCINGGSLYSSSGLLRVAGPEKSFVSASTVSLAAMESSPDRIVERVLNIHSALAFAVENRRAVVGTSSVSYPNVGTDSCPPCGQGRPVTEAQLTTGYATYYDEATSQISVYEIGSRISQVGVPGNVGANSYRNAVDAAIDAAGHAAIVRSDTGALADVLLYGDWASGQTGALGGSGIWVTATIPLNKSTGEFTYLRPAAAGPTYTIWTSSDLVTWTQDTGATQNPTPAGVNQSVLVTLSASPKPLTATKLFVRVKATNP